MDDLQRQRTKMSVDTICWFIGYQEDLSETFLFLSLTLSLPKQYSGDVVQIGEHVMVSGHLYLGNGYNAVTKLLGIFFVLNI